jgi:6-phospho-beta-glucosidase
MKICVVGGGSTYTPELVTGFLERQNVLPLSELALMDISEERLSIVGGFARRMVARAGTPFETTLTTDRAEALDGASYVITQLRVGGMQARREDEYLGRRHGLIGQETTGMGGMAKALRTIPVILDLANAMRERSPGALLVNFANPAGLVTQALVRYTPDVPAVGVCNAPITTKMHILAGLAEEGLEAEPEQAELNTLGLNHLTWHRGMTVDGEEIWPRVMASILGDPSRYDVGAWDADTLRALQMIPNYYLAYYYYTDARIAAQADWPPSRAEEVMEIEERLLDTYADEENDSVPPDLLERGGAYYSTVATQLLNAHHNDLGETHVVNVKHDGAVPGWPEDWVLEMPCRVDGDGVHPLPAEPLPPVCFGLLAQVKMYELLTVEAAVNGDRQAAHKALLAHPLGPSADRVEDVLDDLLETHRTHLPQF